MVADQVQQLGESMAKMLMASSFSGPEKQAWAALVPHMSSLQLQRFMALLEKKLVVDAGQDAEDVLIALKAAEHEHALSVAAIHEKTHKSVEDLEKDLETSS
jgi:hypothetical protein